MNQLQQVFDYAGNTVRTVMVGSEPWFVLKDVCSILGMRAPDVRQRLSDDVVITHTVPDSLGRSNSASIVNEDGLYDVILDSRKPEAKTFRKWITHDVLPSIRKTGGYSIAAVVPQLPSTYKEALVALIAQVEETERLQLETDRQSALLTEQAPKISYYERILASHNSLTIGQIAKDYGLTAELLNHILKKEGVQYKTGGQWVLKSAHMRKGYTESKTGTRGEKGSFVFTKWTQKGRLFIHELLADISVQPNGEGEGSAPLLERTKRRSPRNHRPRELDINLTLNK